MFILCYEKVRKSFFFKKTVGKGFLQQRYVRYLPVKINPNKKEYRLDRLNRK